MSTTEGSPPPAAKPDRLAQLLALLAADPQDTFCLYGLAQERARRGETDEALACYDRCLAVDPAYCYAYFHKAKVLEAIGRGDDAIATLRDGLAQATSIGDRHAASEIAAYLDELT